MVEATFKTMNTVAQLKIEGKDEAIALQQAQAIILDCEKRFNYFSPESENFKLCKNIRVGERYAISEDLYAMLLAAKKVKKETGGFFDIDFANKDAQKDYHLEHGQTIIFDSKKTKLNLGAIAKGFAADKAMEKIKEFNVERAMISMGGHVACFSKGAPWRIGLQDPGKDFGHLLGSLLIANGSLSTSAESYRGQHIKNPIKGNWKSSVDSVSVFEPDGMLADAYSTALFLADNIVRKNLVKGIMADVIIVSGKIISLSCGLYDKFVQMDKEYKIKKINWGRK